MFSALVEMPKLKDREKRVKQFNRARRTLQLEPFVHHSQLESTVAATVYRDSVGTTAPDSGNKQDAGGYQRVSKHVKHAMGKCVQFLSPDSN